MNLFHAALFNNGFKPGGTSFNKLNEKEQAILMDVPHILDSYHYVHAERQINFIRENEGKIFLDSGAFSAWSTGVEINIDDYCNYIKKNLDIIRVEDGEVMASVLDGIGDPQKTLENQQYMEAQGVRPLPCFHFGEPLEYLDFYIKNYGYITIGGMVGKSIPDLIAWLDEIWNYMVNSEGEALLKVHAFGITSVRIMERYPWYSVDSSSWIQYSVFGHIFTNDWGVLSVSEKSPRRKDAGQHLANLTKMERSQLLQKLNSIGFEEERLATVYESRAAFNCWSFCRLNEYINEKRLTNPPKEFMQTQGLF